MKCHLTCIALLTRFRGTIIQHSAFCSGALAHGPALRILPSSRVLQFANYTFDASLLEILTTLIIGGCVCVPSDDDRLNNIAGVITDMKVSWTLLTPSFIQLVQPSSIPTLRTLVLGGENMSQNHLTSWADKLELINAYGPSECGKISSLHNLASLLWVVFNITNSRKLFPCILAIDGANRYRSCCGNCQSSYDNDNGPE